MCALPICKLWRSPTLQSWNGGTPCGRSIPKLSLESFLLDCVNDILSFRRYFQLVMVNRRSLTYWLSVPSKFPTNCIVIDKPALVPRVDDLTWVKPIEAVGHIQLLTLLLLRYSLVLIAPKLLFLIVRIYILKLAVRIKFLWRSVYWLQSLR